MEYLEQGGGADVDRFCYCIVYIFLFAWLCDPRIVFLNQYFLQGGEKVSYSDSIKKYLEGLDGISLADWNKLKLIVDSVIRHEQIEAEKAVLFRNEIAEKYKKYLPLDNFNSDVPFSFFEKGDGR